jgi:hypothetical protein
MDARRNSENNAFAAHDAIFTAAFAPRASKAQSPAMPSRYAELESDPDFVLWHGANGAHI